MLSKVRQGRASISKVHSRLRQLTEDAERASQEQLPSVASSESGEFLTEEDRQRRQVQAGISVLERTSQSIQR